MLFHILILDDEKLVCNSMKRILEDAERDIHVAYTFAEAKNILQTQQMDLILLDYKLADTDGLAVLREIREQYPETFVIMITAFGNIDIAVEAMKLGAYDFIQKKEDPPFIRYTVQRALDNKRLKKEVESLRKTWKNEINVPEIISVSPIMKQVLARAREYAKSNSTVLITGSTGTGKNMLTRFIHFQSPRFTQPLIHLNCSVIPRELIETELFGYEKGAFTGARQKGKMGLIERANNGTLFLDEIGELPFELQTKLLQILESGEFYRVAAVEPSRVDIRIIAATNCNLQERVEQKKFRADLFYRLNVAPLHIPPLRERKEDILPLAKHFIEEFNGKLNKTVTKVSPEVCTFLETAPWEGNIRELRNNIERAMLLKKDSVLTLQDFTMSFAANMYINKQDVPSSTFSIHIEPQPGENLLHAAQKRMIIRALELTEQNRSKAAKLLGIPRTSLNFYLQRYGMI